MEEKKKAGRPPKPEDQRLSLRYRHIAVRTKTHVAARRNSIKRDKLIMDYIDDLVAEDSKKLRFE